MKSIFDTVSKSCSKIITKTYSTSFSIATKILDKSISQDIYNIYGFVRLADEIVDSFSDYDQEKLFDRFEEDLYNAIENKISLNPILNAFQETVHKYDIPICLYESFMESMRTDLRKSEYHTVNEYKNYIYGSADVVGLMCLKVFVNGDQKKFDELEEFAESLGSAFQKVNFLRDLKADSEVLKRSYFPNVQLQQFDEFDKERIIIEIETDFEHALKGIKKLPSSAKLGVYTAYIYYKKLLERLIKSTPNEIMNQRIRVPNHIKALLLAKSYIFIKTNRL